MNNVCPNCFGEGSGGNTMTAYGVDDRTCWYSNGTGELPVPKYWLTVGGDCVLAEFKGDLAKADRPTGTRYARFDSEWRWIERPATNGYGV
jgi:hypothetical protein